MRRRKDQAWTLTDVMPHAWAGTPLLDEEAHEFRAMKTEEGVRNMLHFTTVVAGPVFCSMTLVHIFRAQFLGIKFEGRWIWPPVLVCLSCALLWYNKHHLQRLVKCWPFVCGSLIQVALDMAYVSLMVTCACQFNNELMRHRIFLTSFLPWVFGGTSIFYVPWPVVLLVTCPIHLSAWYIFHRLEGFQRISCHIWGLAIIAMAIYLHRSRHLSWWQTFKANRALLEERVLLQKTQDSLRGILSSIFDASCTCDSDGRFLECSPHLQAVLDCSRISEVCEHDRSLVGLNLCSFSASDLESQRLRNFLKHAKATAQHQAVKIQCSFMNNPQGSLEASLYAVVLPATTPYEHEHGVLFISMSLHSSDLSTWRQKAEPCSEVAEQVVALSTVSPTAIRGKLAELDSSEVPFGDALPLASSRSLPEHWDSSQDVPQFCDLNPMSQKTSFTSGHDAIEHDTLVSLALSESTPASAHRHVTLNLQKTSSVETQTAVANLFVDAEVQTLGSATRPPARNRTASFRQKRKQVRGMVRPFIDAFRVTPAETIETMMFVHILQSINPKCSVGCCMTHRLLDFLGGKVKIMMNMECRNWPVDDVVQCVHCGALQEKDAGGQFQCDVCLGVRAREPLNLKSSSSEAGDISNCNAGDADASG